MMTDVLIVGAGLAGLSAGLACKRRGIDCRILEATGDIGGRALTRKTPSGTPVDLGGHWLHGEKTPLKGVLTRYGIGYGDDNGDTLICENGKVRKGDEDNWLESVIDQGKAERIRRGKAPDCPLPELALNDKGRKRLEQFALMWDGIDPPQAPSAREFLTDENTPGGLQLDGGMAALTHRMADEIGHGRIRLHTPISRIASISDGVQVEASDGSHWNARRVIFTASIGVLAAGMVAFDPPLSADFQRQLSGFIMGEMGKVVVEVDPAFLDERGIKTDTGLLLLDATLPHFCHLRSHCLPLISLYVSGRRMREVERLNADQALGYVSTLLRPITQLAGFEAHVTGEPMISHWVGNPYTRGAYSGLMPGHERPGPRLEGAVCFCGEAFDTRFPASLAGAYRSGEAAVALLCDQGLMALPA